MARKWPEKFKKHLKKYLNENKPIKTRKGDLPNNRSFSFNYYNTYKSCLKKLEIG